MRLFRRLGNVGLALLFAAALALPGLFGAAAGDVYRYRLEGPAEVDAGKDFSVRLRIGAEGAPVSAFRVYLLYDAARFALKSYQRAGVVRDGMFALRDASGETAKYPRGMSAAQRAEYGLAVVQWASVPAKGSLPVMDNQGFGSYITFVFTMKADAPYEAGKILLSSDYEEGDSPWFHEGLDLTGAVLLTERTPPPPELKAAAPGIVVDEARGYVYGFPQALSRLGGVSPWRDADLGNYLTATNRGVLSIDNSLKPENRDCTGTGSRILLWNATKTKQFGAYTLVVFGDLDGNFVVDLDDYAELLAMKAGKRPGKLPGGWKSKDVFDSPWHLAADVCGALGTVDDADLLGLYGKVIGGGGTER